MPTQQQQQQPLQQYHHRRSCQNNQNVVECPSQILQHRPQQPNLRGILKNHQKKHNILQQPPPSPPPPPQQPQRLLRNTTFVAQKFCVRETIAYKLTGLIIVILLLCTNAQGQAPPEPYYGKFIGHFSRFGHGINGSVYAIDESTIFIKAFTYTGGEAPKAYFWVGKTMRPGPEGYIIPYPEEYTGSEPPILQEQYDVDIILRLPMGKRIRDIRWLSVYCIRFTVNFGDVMIPERLEVPKPRVLPEFKRLAHGLQSSNISILDAKTFYIPNLHYDGAGPDAYFWVGNGTEPNIMGHKVPNEMGSLEPLRGYQGEDIEIQLPNSLTVYDIDWLAVWCVEYRHNFGHVYIPKDLDVPPALGQTKITTSTAHPRQKNTNCREVLSEKLQVKWDVQGENLIIELNGRIQKDEYMAFGLSGANGRSQMVGGDVVVAFFDTQAKVFRADDYYISHLSQCDGKQGVCPDERIGGRNDVVFLTGEQKNGVTKIKYSRPLQTNEPVNDRAIPTDGREVNVIAAIGPLNSRREANAHPHKNEYITDEDVQIDFTSKSDASCKSVLYDIVDESGPKAWPTRKLFGEQMISVKIGPTGGKRGYQPITGHSSWGIALYLNDLLIPELYVERGQTYTFVVETGDEPSQPARYHPFYITDSHEGGFGQLSESKQRRETVFAGVEYTSEGYARPTAAGRYCEWKHKTIDRSAEIETFEEYTKTLRLECDPGEPAYLNWTVDFETPNTVYYQCYTHTYLGWKINVVDPGQTSQRNHVNSSCCTKRNQFDMIIFATLTLITFRTISKFRYA